MSLPIDPDFAMFNLWGFTGSKYGKDYVDCKSPAIHIYFNTLYRLVGDSVERVRFAHHLLISLAAFPIWLLSGEIWVAVAYIVLVQSGWLLAFHGNVGQQPAALIAIALLIDNPWVTIALMFVAVAFEPKLVLSVALYGLVTANIIPLLVFTMLSLALALIIKIKYPVLWGYLWEANITIPQRMTKARASYPAAREWMPWWEARGWIYLLPWLFLAGAGTLSYHYWLPIIAYVVILKLGWMIRPNHLLPLVGFIIPMTVYFDLAPLIILILIDWISGGFYLGDIWFRFYDGIRQMNIDARSMGEWIKDNCTGTVWVNDMHCGINIYSGKPILYGLAEQIEIREVADERREAMLEAWKKDNADWVVEGGSHLVDLDKKGYNAVAENPSFRIYKRS